MTYVTARKSRLGQNELIMAETKDALRRGDAAVKARTRALIVPREHGAWGLLIIPLFTGVAAGIGDAQRYWPMFVFILAAVSLFWLRTPVESLLASGPMRASSSQERRIALIASSALAALATACLITIMWGGNNLKLLSIGLAAAAAFAVQTILRGLGRNVRMASQLVGAVGLTATAPAAYYLGTGRLDSRGLVLWLANWLFAWNQIHFVQLRIHAARVCSFPQKLLRGKFFLCAQIVLLATLILLAAQHLASPLIVIAFLPVLVRGMRWFFIGQQPLDVKKLGWSEMRQGAAFGVLLMLAFIVR